jgi:hypothetical protein
MSVQSRSFRLSAALHLRESRRTDVASDQVNQLCLARAYKSMARSEERVEGEPEKSQRRAWENAIQTSEALHK